MATETRVTSAGHHGRCRPCVLTARHRQAGLTIVELILVIVILGVLGALAGPRFFSDRSFAERAYAEELASALRYAQKVAVGSGCLVRVQISATSYSLAQQAPQAGHCNPADASFPVAVSLSSGQAASGSAPAGVTVTPAGAIVFDALGRTSLG
ncbi:MAG: GspH/FimT family pseudopilin, partial [Woeseia sp.]